jgi:catechol 2,3-dioxygenase-like lactoylglutathione lyase family enzyme
MAQELAFLREEENTGRLLAPRSIFKATAINHLSYGVSVENYEETRDWYMDIFGMECVYDDGDQASVACGKPRREIYIRKRDKAPFMDHWAISIADFNAEDVQQTLLKWGIEGVGWDGDFAWHATDDNGFLTQICAEAGVFPGAACRGWNTDGKIPSGDKASRPGKSGWKATGMNHILYGVPDYKRTRDFYIDLFGMRVVFEDGIKCALNFGSNPEDSIYIVRRDDGPVIDHIAISIADFDLQKTEEVINKLGLEYSADGDSAWTLTDPNGYRVQVCAETGVYPGAAHDFFHQTRTKQ